MKSQTHFSNLLQENVGKNEKFLLSDHKDAVPFQPNFCFFKTQF